ncbi:hypothetical protein CBL_08917 [Carabus blaptoides fortunei]
MTENQSPECRSSLHRSTQDSGHKSQRKFSRSHSAGFNTGPIRTGLILIGHVRIGRLRVTDHSVNVNDIGCRHFTLQFSRIFQQELIQYLPLHLSPDLQGALFTPFRF